MWNILQNWNDLNKRQFSVSCYFLSLSCILGNIENICLKLLDTFSKQPVSMQDMILMRLSALRVALYSMNVSTHQKAADCHARLVLQAIHAVFRALLRPKAITTQDKVRHTLTIGFLAHDTAQTHRKSCSRLFDPGRRSSTGYSCAPL